MVCISLVYCNGVCMCVHPLWTVGVHARRCSIDRRCATWAARQTRRFRWLTAVSADAAKQTRRLWRHGGVGPTSSQCTYYVLVSITMVHLIVCSTRKRCTSTRWIHSNYRFWVSFGIHLQFCLKVFGTNLSNSSHTVRRLKFPFMSSFSASFHTTFVLKVFVSVVIGNSISLSHYTGRSRYVCFSVFMLAVVT
jgi:hypothetical protein